MSRNKLRTHLDEFFRRVVTRIGRGLAPPCVGPVCSPAGQGSTPRAPSRHPPSHPPAAAHPDGWQAAPGRELHIRQPFDERSTPSLLERLAAVLLRVAVHRDSTGEAVSTALAVH